MKSYIRFAVLILTVLSFNDCVIKAELPSYITACSRSDPKLNECALKVARSASSKFAQGDASKGIPKLEPIEIKEVRSGGGGPNGVKLILKDAQIIGPGSLEIKKLNLDLVKRKVAVSLYGDLRLESKYEVDGRILILPITGKGRAHLNLRDVKVQYSFDFNIVKGKDGKEYVNIKKDDIKHEIGKATIKLDNLFNGDKVLGESTNRLINDSWREILAELSPPIVQEMKLAATKTIQAFLSIYTYDDLFLP